MAANKRAQIVSELNRQLRTAEKMEPEYLRIDDCYNVFGVSRGFLWPLISAKPPVVRSIHIMRPGRQRGIRLVDVRSLRDFLSKYEVGG
jgi:hypothetical protein